MSLMPVGSDSDKSIIFDTPDARGILFCDLDKTIRQHPGHNHGYVNCADDVKVYDEVPSILREWKSQGYYIAGITNQGGIAHGYTGIKDVQSAIEETNYQCGYIFDTIKFCPHHRLTNSLVLSDCFCRKPGTELLFRAKQEIEVKTNHQFFFPKSFCFFVGDSKEDYECSKNAGIKFILARKFREGDKTPTSMDIVIKEFYSDSI